MKLSVAGLIAALFLTLLIATTAIAERRVSASLSGLPRTLPRDARLFVRTLSLASGQVTNSAVLRRKAAFSAQPSADPSVIAVTYLSRSSNKLLSGLGKKFVAGLPRKKLSSALTIRLRKPKGVARGASVSKSVMAASSATTIGFPIDGIKIVGPDDFPLTGRSQIQLLVTSLVNDVACYGKSDGFAIVELDPEIQKARQFEFDLCSSGRADPASCPRDLYQPPTNLVRGTLDIRNDSATLSLILSDASGNELSRFTSNGSLKSIATWEALTKDMARKLGSTLCNRGFLQVQTARCETPTCNLSCGSLPAIRTLPKIVGVARPGGIRDHG
jgi:hypothetical protein